MFKNRIFAWAITAMAVMAAIYMLFARMWEEARPPASAAGAEASTTKISADKQLWSCSMHPWVIKHEPGICPICHMALTPMHSHASTMDSTSARGPEVQIDPAMVQNMGVRVAQVVRGQLNESVHAVGSIMVPETSLHEINPRVGGWITRLYANQDGMHIRQGEALYELYSPELKTAAEELVWAVGAGREHGDSVIESAHQRLRLMGVADPEIDKIVADRKVPDAVVFRSPVSGAVEDKMVVEGSAVQAGMKLMRIDDHSTLWLVARVFAPDMAAVKVDQTVDVAVDGLPGQSFGGKVSFVHPHVDMDTRTLIVRITLDNSTGELKPGMFASADIFTTPAADTIIVPREAVIDTGIRQTVFVAQDGGHFEPRIVTIGASGDDQLQVLSGLSPGEKVVVSGQFLLDVESRRIEAMQKFRGEDAEAK